MPLDLNRVEELFHAARQIGDLDERQARLETVCAGDSALRERVEALLRADAEARQFLNRPAVEHPNAVPPGTADMTQGFDRSGAEVPRTGGDRQDKAPGVEIGFLQPSGRTDALGRLGHYEVLEVIGQGGFGIVLKAFDEKLHRVVAVKVLAPELAANGSARKRFIREARTAAAVKNEHVVGIYEVDDEAQPPYLAMEMIDGVSLQDKIDRHGPLGLNEILRIGLQMAEGLAAAHKQGLVHRDIKPANILLENGVERVKITDFGLARAVDDASVSQSGTVAGTPMYMSPEQAEGLPIDHRSDLFSLGTVLYAMCTGHSAFRASGTHAVLNRVIDASPRPIREINHEIPNWLCDIVGKLHAKQPEDRFQTAKEVAELLGERLADVQAGRPIVGSGSAGGGIDGPQPRGATVAGAPVADAAGFDARRRRRLVLAAAAGPVLLVVLWCAPSIFRYLANRGSVEFVPQAGMLDVIVLQNNVSVTDWMGIRQDGRTISLPAGQYRINGSTTPGHEMAGWELTTSNWFVRVTRRQPGSGCDLEVHRGDRVVIRPLAKSVQALPRTAPPKTAAEVLPALAGVWKGEFTQKVYGSKPDVKEFRAVAVNDWIVERKWLRQRVHMVDGGFLSLVSFEPRAATFREWFFHARGLIFGRSAGRWEPATRTMTWTNLPQDGVVLLTTWRFVDADTITWEILIRDEAGQTIFEMASRMKRTTESVAIDETSSAGPLPTEMAVLDRLVGDWQDTGVITDTKSSAPLKAVWQSVSRRVLGGRVIATQATGHPLEKETYALSTFDTFSNAYGRWLFEADGNVLEFGGDWDAKTQTMKWHRTVKDGSQCTDTWRLRDNQLDSQCVHKDPLGKTTLDVQTTGIRTCEPDCE